MPRLTRDSNVTVGTKDYKIEELLKTIIFLPADQIKTFFMELGLKVPRELRMFVLRESLRGTVIETRKSRLTLADELNYRLSWFTEFTESQLENLLVFFEDPKIERDFLEEFWTDLIAYMVEKNVSFKHLKNLLDDIQANIFNRAKAFRDDHITEANTWDEFVELLDNKTGFISAHWDGTPETEEKIKEQTKATIRCIPLDNKQEAGTCILSGNPSTQRVLFARAY